MRNRYGLPAPQPENEFYRPYHHGTYLGTPIPPRHRGRIESKYRQWSPDAGSRSHRINAGQQYRQCNLCLGIMEICNSQTERQDIG